MSQRKWDKGKKIKEKRESYDDNTGKKKKVIVKGMNRAESLEQKRDLTMDLLSHEREILFVRHFNPITREFFAIKEERLISTKTPLCVALEKALKLVNCQAETKKDVGNKLKYINKAAFKLSFDFLPVCEIRKSHIRFILEECGTLVKKWTPGNFNLYRKWLSLLFSQLEDIEAVDHNPVTKIKKQKTTKRIRLELTAEERKKVALHLKTKYYRFWLFMQVFFHSGSRESELMRIQGKDVSLDLQQFKRLIKKGKQETEVITPIKDIALPYWKEIMAGCGPQDYVFSKALKPGPAMIKRYQITKRWYRLVKKPLNIQADFYSLKHSNLDETADALNLLEASKMAGHTTPIITMKYTQGEQSRRNERLKKVNNAFSE